MRKVLEFLGNDDLLDGLRVFNTFRVGSKWKDIQPGDLLDVHVNDVFKGTMLVAQAEVGPMFNMLQLHTGLNTSRDFSKMDMPTMAGSLWTELDDIYGNTQCNTPVTVIYLVNTKVL